MRDEKNDPPPADSVPALTHVQVGLTSTSIGDDGGAARRSFQRFHAVFCQSLLEPALLSAMQRLCETGGFLSDQTQPGHREVEAPQRAGRALNLVLSRPEVLRWLEEISGCGRLHRVEGRVAQIFPRPGDGLVWHDDNTPGEDRRLAIVIPLGTAEYEGGDFELRPKRGELLLQHHHREPGSAMIFAVGPELEHRVTPLTRGGPRRVYAGWAIGTENIS